MRLFAVVQAEALHRAHPAYEYFDQLHHRIMAGLGRIVRGLTAEPEATAREIYAVMMGLEMAPHRRRVRLRRRMEPRGR